MQQTEINGIYRDDNGALLNKDAEGLHAYRLKKQQTRRIDILEKRIEKLELLINQLLRERNG